jgi:hypothetical protein
MTDEVQIRPYAGPAGGWGSLSAVGAILTQEEVATLGSEISLKQDKADGFMCIVRLHPESPSSLYRRQSARAVG